MGMLFAIIAVLCYLLFFVDGKEFLAVMRGGGWSSVVFYCLIGLFVYLALSAAPEVAQQGMHGAVQGGGHH